MVKLGNDWDEILKDEWEKPYYAGESAEFRVEANKLTEVEPITCTFRSLKVSVVFGEKLRAAMESDVMVTVVANDEGRLEYLPSDGRAGVVNFVTDTVINAGGNPCPPVIVGVGIGGTFEQAALLAKKALLRKVNTPSSDEQYAELEQEIK